MTMLKSDNELAKKINLTEVHELSVEDKRNYIDEQVDGIKSQLWRARVDAILNHNLATDGEQEKLAVEAKIREHESNARRYVEAITLLSKLRDEL